MALPSAFIVGLRQAARIFKPGQPSSRLMNSLLKPMRKLA